MILLSIFVLSFFVVAIIAYIVFQRYEKIVCTEICNIYCNTIVSLDQCAGIAKDILNEWQKFSIKATLNHKVDTRDVEKILKMLELKSKNVVEMCKITPELLFDNSLPKQRILAKHKLPLQEIHMAITLPKTTYEELKALIDETMCDLVNADSVDFARIDFTRVRFMVFLEETIGMYYASMEGICSFPLSVLRLYEDVSHKIKYLPTEVGCNKRKEDYLHFQELQMNKAQNLLESFKDSLDNEDNFVKNYAENLLKKEINLFFSGSKELETERNVFNGAVVRQQTKWKTMGLNIYGFSYQNFPSEVVLEGHQAAYNTFIQNDTDAIFFVLNGTVGNYTEKEFMLAMHSFKEKGKPKIYVYSKKNDVWSPSIEKMRKCISSEGQYWQDYTNNTHLKLLIEKDMTDVVATINEENANTRRKFLE